MNNMGGFQRKASVVFYLTDSFNGAPVKNARILLGEDTPGVSFVNKKDGYYVLSNLPRGDYSFYIEADNYLAVKKEISLPANEGPAVLQVNMQHDINSKLIDDTTRIRASVRIKPQKPLAGVLITVAVITPVVYGRLVEKTQKDQQKIRLFSREGPLLEGRQLFIFCKEGEDLLSITGYHREEDSFFLQDKLSHDYNSGTPLYLTWRLQTDNNGELILPLPDNLLGGDNMVEVKAWYEGKKAGEKLKLETGRVTPATITMKLKKG